MLELYADECVDARIIDQLRRRGVDIVATGDEGLLRASDRTQFARATALGRVLISEDHDFLALARESQATGRAFPGLVFIKPNTPIGKIVEGLMLRVEVLDPEDMQNWIEWVP